MKINSLNISSVCKTFETKEYNNPEENEEILKLKNEFLKTKGFFEEIEECSYGKNYKIYYYVGSVAFKQTKTDKGNMSLDLKLDQDFINTIISMSLNNVCEIAEEQTRQFQNIFTSFVKENCDSIEKSSEKVKKGLLSRIVKQPKLK
jgi:uncharacterized protein YpbB